MGRSQISLFIVIGMMVLIVAAIIAYTSNLGSQAKNQEEILKSYSIKNNLDPVRLYTESCIRQIAAPIILEIGANGGTLKPISYRSYFGKKLNYLCENDALLGCKSTLLQRSVMEREISEKLEKELPKCVNLEIFKNQGYSVETDNMEASTLITNERVIINISYPMSFSSGGVARAIRYFDAEINMPLGELFRLALSITGEESKKGYFDSVEFMKTSDIMVEKHRPYPDIIYYLSKDGFSFNFALQGKDTSGSPGEHELQKPGNGGCCYTEDTCYANSDPIECSAKLGFYDPSERCACAAIADKTNHTGQDCRLSTGIKKDGESWCDYDGIAGYGFDNVGSRHYLKYCIDGIAYTEECRDYREEFCTEEKVIPAGLTKATCRINRWLDCASCTTENCCKNTDLRDCTWLSNLSVKNKCAPFVPPGLRHWENSGREACSLGFEEKYCTGISCGNSWLNDAAKSCFMRGDCGNYWNTEGKVTYGGFFHTDLVANSDTAAYDIKKQADIVRGNENTPIQLGINNRNIAQNQERLSLAGDNFAKVVSSVYSVLDAVSSMSSGGELNGYNSAKVFEVAVCEPWKSPRNSDDCSKCLSYSSCSEYLCKSLGQNCIYEEKEGFPDCRKAAPESGKMEITADKASLPEGYAISPTTLEINGAEYDGYKVTPELKPYKIFSLGVNTTKKSICRQHFAPKSSILASGGYYFGEPVYSTTFQFNILQENARPIPPSPTLAFPCIR